MPDAIEIAFWSLTTGERGRFVPTFDEADLQRADRHALAVNKFYERGLHTERQDTGEQLTHLHKLLTGATIVGSNPGFDAGKLNLAFARHGGELTQTPWHAVLDLRFYAADILGLTGNLPGLSGLCRLLDVPPGEHTAESDVTAVGRCYLALRRLESG
jgi:hypothetical protein